MPALANVAHLLFESAALAPETFQVVDFAGEERISQLFSFEINLVSDDPEVDLAAVINQPATLVVLRGLQPVPLHGIVADFQQGGRTSDRYAYRAVLVPHLWLLSLTYQSRIFQNMTVEEIVTDVLTGAGLTDYRFELQGSYQPREYCVQYRETDLSFVSRLLEHEGIRFFFEHGDKDVLVMTDDPGASPRIPGEDAVTYNAGGGMVAEAEAVREFICRERVVTGKVVLKDYNYRTPETPLQAESQLNGEMPGLYYDYGQHFKDQSEGDRLAQVRNEEIECQRRVMFGDSNCAGLRSGHLFTLQDHYRDSLNGDYLITQVRHAGGQGASLPGLGGNGQSVYHNEFTCIPAAVPYRPPRLTPTPQIPGLMTARTETAGGDYAHLDEEGRYHAKMHFDLSDKTSGEASRPIRMNQPYGGPNYGMHFPSHADAEIVWACVDGDPDRPLGLGIAPNPSNAAPVASGNKSQNLLRTWSGNELLMDDTKGEEQVRLTTPASNAVLLDDKDDRVVVQTTSGHTLTFDDKNRAITLRSRDGHTARIDDEKQKITVRDASGKHSMTIDAASAAITISTATGDINLRAPNGTVDIQSKAFKVQTTEDTKLESQNVSTAARTSYELKGPKVKVDGPTSVDIASGGPTTIKGSVVDIN